MKEIPLNATQRVKFDNAVSLNKSQSHQPTAEESKVDTASVCSGVSSILDPFLVSDLVAFLGIGDFIDKSQNLPGVTKDYNDVLHTFVTIWKYKVFYKTSKNVSIYTNDIETNTIK